MPSYYFLLFFLLFLVSLILWLFPPDYNHFSKQPWCDPAGVSRMAVFAAMCSHVPARQNKWAESPSLSWLLWNRSSMVALNGHYFLQYLMWIQPTRVIDFFSILWSSFTFARCQENRQKTKTHNIMGCVGHWHAIIDPLYFASKKGTSCQ